MQSKSTMHHDISRAKCALPIPQLMMRLGVPRDSIPTRDGQAVRCPWHNKHRHGDRHPSFSIYHNGTRSKCFTCDFNLDGPAFVARWLSLSKGDAFRKYNALASGIAPIARPQLRIPQQLSLPKLWPINETDRSQLSAVRRISEAAISWACNLDVLHFAIVCRQPSWLLTDPARKIAESRRLNGEHYPASPTLDSRKAHTIQGSCKAWPLGVALLQRYPEIRAIMLVEGGPDYLAAFHFLHLYGMRDVMPVAMLGRSVGKFSGIEPEALRLLAGKRVRIYPHADADGGGMKGAQDWASQLRLHGCAVDYFQFNGLQGADGSPAKDLNDLTSLLPGYQRNFSNLLP